jgi:hypothetical protein
MISGTTYAQITRSLPRPTPAQGARFLEYVATARPWAALLPADGGVPFTLLLNPQAGRHAMRGRSSEEPDSAMARYRESFGYLDYLTPVVRSDSVLTGQQLDLPSGYYILDELEDAIALPPELLTAASCVLNAALHPDASLLLETLSLRVPQVFDPGADRLDPLDSDAELRAFAEEYTREELAGFVCPTDREAWASRWLESFGPLHKQRHAEQRARLERALAGLLAWLDSVDKD